MTRGHPDRGQLPHSITDEARTRPGGWVYEIVGDSGREDRVPASAIRGAWKVDDSGEVTGEFVPNPNFGRVEG
jgi:hypothetical protein